MLDDLTALITGASQGIGREIALTFAEHGADVVLAARSDGIYETESLIHGPGTGLPVETDVTDEASVEAAVDAAVDAYGGLDCLVNNAGIAGPTAPIEEIDRADWERTMDVNVTGMFLASKHAVPALRASDQGSICNISSISGKRPLVERSPYTASKMAVIGLTRTLAFELGPDVRVNCICPGPVAGPRLDRVIEAQAERLDVSYEEAAASVFLDDLALDELTQPESVASMAAFLASDLAADVTAQDINVDGGATWY